MPITSSPNTSAGATFLTSGDLEPYVRSLRFVQAAESPVLAFGDGVGGYATFTDVWYDGGTFYAAVHVSTGIRLYTSSNGKTGWASQGLILEPAPGEWDQTTVGVPSLWKEGSTWHMLYRGTGTKEAIGYATASAATGPWTRQNGGEPVLEGTAGQWDSAGIEAAPGNPIKVGSTYYMFYEGSGVSRSLGRKVGVATSTDLITWTKNPANPILYGGRFCPSAWKDGDWYYMLCTRYPSEAGTGMAEIELWRSSAPTFLVEEREYLGIIKRPGATGAWDGLNLDTPVVLSDSVERDTRTVTDGELWAYYAGQSASGWGTGLLIGEVPVTPDIRATQPNVSILGRWQIANLAANRSGFIALLGSPDDTTYQYLQLPHSGYVTHISIESSETRTAGTATATLSDTAGNGLGLSVALNATYTTRNAASLPLETLQFSAGDRFGMALTSSSWGPTTADLTVTIAGVLR